MMPMSNSITQATSGLLNVQFDPAAAAVSARSGASGANDHVAAASSPVDRTTLSPLGQLLDSATRSAIALSSFRPDRVAQLGAALADGSYRADLVQVAQRVTQALQGAAESATRVQGSSS
jgi:flagellar biosynthesis anti-sigma factor FlgM